MVSCSPLLGRVKGTIHWVAAEHAVQAEVRLYDHLCNTPNPDDVAEGQTWLDNLNPDSLQSLTNCHVEPSLQAAKPGESFHFERVGYFCVDAQDSQPESLVFNRTVSLRDTWAKVKKKGG